MIVKNQLYMYKKNCDIRLLSNKRSSYLINKEKEEYDKKKRNMIKKIQK